MEAKQNVYFKHWLIVCTGQNSFRSQLYNLCPQDAHLWIQSPKGYFLFKSRV